MLHEILNRLLGKPTAPAAPALPQPQPHPQNQAPSDGQLYAALQKYRSQGSLPMDNLDGSYSGQPVGTSVFKNTAQWFPPLKVGVTVPGDNLARFDPLNSPVRQDDSQYPIIPINPAAVPKPLPYMPYMRGGQ